MMRKGMFYLLPLLALTQLGASHAALQVDKGSLITVKAPMTSVVIESRGKDSPQVINTLPRPIAGRNRMAKRNLVVGLPPRAGRNVRRVAHGRQLLKRR